MEDPADRGWKPNGRPQSTMARNFLTELDDLFKIDGGLDLLDKNVHQKKQAVSTHTQELEALEARLRETEERLKVAKSSPPTRKDSQRRSPIEDVFPGEHKARVGQPTSPSVQRQNRQRPSADTHATRGLPDRPRTAQSQEGQTA